MLRLFAKITTLTGARLLGAACGFVTTLLITRYFGADALALYAVALAAAALVAVGLVLGLPAFAQMLTAEYEARKQPGYILGLALTGFSLLAGLTIVFGLCAYLFGGMIGDLIPSLGSAGLAAVVAIAPGAALLNINGSILGGLQRQVAAQLPEALMRPAGMLALVALTSVIGFTQDGTTLLVFAAGIVWGAALAQLLLLWRALARLTAEPGLPRPKFELARWRKLTPPWFSISVVADYVIEFHLIAAAFFLAPVEIALLHVCFRIRLLAGLGMRSIYSIFLPKLFHAMALGDETRVRNAVAMSNWLSAGYAFCAISGLAVLGGYVLAVFEPDFAAGHGLLMLISVAFLGQAALGPAMSVLASNRAQGTILIILSTSLAVSATILILGTPVFGIIAVGTAYTTSLMFNAITAWIVVRRRFAMDTAVWAGGRPRLAPFADMLKPSAPTTEPPVATKQG